MERPPQFQRKQKKPSFFKVLIQKDFPTRLLIPPTFIEKFGKDLQNEVVLKVSYEKSWEVDVQREGKDVCFKKGWETFVKDNTLEFGDFVVFKYSANSTFKATIYGTTGCEKEIPAARKSNTEPLVDEDNQGKVKDQRKRKWVKVEDENHLIDQRSESDGILNKGNGRAKIGSQIDGAKFHTRDVNHVMDIDYGSSDDAQIGNLEQQSKPDKQITLWGNQRTASSGNNGKSTTLLPEPAIDFNSSSPFFEVELPKAYVTADYMNIPTSFFFEHMKEEEQDVKLQMLENIWNAKITLYYRPKAKSNAIARIMGGWKGFVRDNGLRKGDTCIFELIKSDSILFRVHIHRR